MYHHEALSIPAPIAEITSWRTTAANKLTWLRSEQGANEDALVVLRRKFICDQFNGRRFMEQGCEDTVVLSKRWG